MAVFDVTVTSDPAGDPPVVSVSGDLDIGAVTPLERSLARAERVAADVLALDLSEVEMLDSSGLRVLLDAARRARALDRRLVIVAPAGGPVARLLELTLLAEHLDVVRDLDVVAG